MTLLLIFAAALGTLVALSYGAWKISRGEGGMKKLAIASLTLVGLGYGMWTVFYPTTRMHAKITIDVETPEGLKTGSSVQEVVFKLEPCPLCNHTGPKLRRNVRGEAVAVDLGERGTLFALLNGGAGGQITADPILPHIVMTVLAKNIRQNEEWATAEIVRRLRHVSGKADIPSDLMLYLVRFRDIADPKTVERVDPDNLAASFGPGVKLVKAAIEIVPSGWWPLNDFGITGTALTTGIEKKLAWLPEIIRAGGAIDGTRFPGTNDLKSNLGGGAFKW